MALNRLSPADLTNLALEAPDTLMHQAALGVLDGAALLDASGRVRIGEIRSLLQPRLSRMPELLRVLYVPRPLEGRPIWIDDPNFHVENHLLVAPLPPPGGETAALEFAGRIMATPMDRARPLWDIWFLEGYGERSVGVLVRTHHALLDGPAMVNLFAQLFDLEADSVQALAPQWSPSPQPTPETLMIDNISQKARGIARFARNLGHPLRMLHSAITVTRGVRQGRRAPRTSLNRPIGSARRVATFRVSLSDVTRVAHENGVKVNDVFMSLVAGALRSVLLERGESVAGLKLHVSMAVSLHPREDKATVGNEVGTMIVPLALDEADPLARLKMTAAASRFAKSTQQASATPTFMVLLARSGLMRQYIRHQHVINVLTTNLPGPHVPIYIAGARLLDVFAIPPIAGNVTVSFAALSYDGGFGLSVIADAASWPDLDVLLHEMRAGWLELIAASAKVPKMAGQAALAG